ncbi:MAG TPA: S9 family peptidase, partial [Bacteroidales bacterium]|nr:S9 family peptidase [Bacteroidales bacterium]
MKIKPPVAKKIPHDITVNGHTRTDNYYWLKDRDDANVIKYLEEENRYREDVMKDVRPFQDALFEEMVGRIKQTDMSVPYLYNGYYYYSRYEEGKEYPFYCRRKGSPESPEEMMLNVNEMAEGHSYYNVTGLSVSPDNRVLSYGVDTVSRRLYTIHFKDLETGRHYSDLLPDTTGGAAWANDNKTVFYTVKDQQTLRSFRVKRHKLGQTAGEDVTVYEEKDETFVCGAYTSKSKNYIMIGAHATLSDEYRFLDANDPGGTFTVVQPRRRNLEYSVSHYKDRFYIVTNYKARNFRLMETHVGSPALENWKEVIGHRDDVYLSSVDIFTGFLVISERKDGLNQIRIKPWNGEKEHYIHFEEEAYTAYTSVNPEFNTGILRFSYTSMTTPGSVYDYNMNTRERTLLKQQEVVGSFNPADYETKRLYATASDGTKIPVSMVYRKNITLNGKNPLLLYGYGSYGITVDPSFSTVRLSLLDRGFIFAIAHIRGGQIYGRQWYDDGKLLKKMNTFTDFISCAGYLIKENFTGPDHLYAMGGSAGGLLMGAVINLEPELFKGVIAAVPFVDVVTTMLDDSIPLTTGEYDEWG